MRPHSTANFPETNTGLDLLDYFVSVTSLTCVRFKFRL